MLNYIFLILAIVAEAAGTTFLKMSEQFTKLVLIISGVAVLNLFSKMDIH
jgi:small multidrug resistance pump